MRLLGLRLDDHDSSFCLYDNGKLSYLKTERVYQEKHHSYDNNWEWKIDFEKFFKLSVDELDEIAIVADPLRYNVPQFLDFQTKTYSKLNVKCPVIHVEHHLAHALSAFMFPETKYQFVFDGVGELFQNTNQVTGTVWSVFKDYKLINRNTPEFEQTTGTTIRIRNSFGVEYENLARHLDITAEHPDDLAGKLMSLQSYGTVDKGFLEYLNSRLTNIKSELSVSVHPDNWTDYKGSENIGNLTKLDFAATIHKFMENQILSIIRAHANKNDSILLTGGCAQNICWNTTIRKEFPNTVVAPHSADDGLSLGALNFLLRKYNLSYTSELFPYWQQDEVPDSKPTNETIQQVAQMLADGKIVGWYQGRGEIGPRALGNRSILMNPTIPDAKKIINTRVKNREDYRPFGATVLEEYSKEWFEHSFKNPHMLYTGIVNTQVPSITHIDGTCRYQTLGEENPTYRKLIEAFNIITGVPLLLNTSLNRGGKPIAGSKRDALGVLYDTDLDVLVYGNEIIYKE
jgi:carbamoyltransferase